MDDQSARDDDDTSDDAGERRSSPVRGSLPLVSTAPLTAAERDGLRELRRRFQFAVATLDDVLACGRVDKALDGLHQVAGDTDGLALAAAARIGRGR